MKLLVFVPWTLFPGLKKKESVSIGPHQTRWNETALCRGQLARRLTLCFSFTGFHVTVNPWAVCVGALVDSVLHTWHRGGYSSVITMRGLLCAWSLFVLL